MKTLTLKETLQALLDGKRIRPASWPKKCYIELRGDTFCDDDGEFAVIETFGAYVMAENQEEKPKKMKAMYRYFYQQPYELYFLQSPQYFANDQDFKRNHPYVTYFMPLKSTEILVEENNNV